MRSADHLQISDEDVANSAKSAKFMQHQQGTRGEGTLKSGAGTLTGANKKSVMSAMRKIRR
jgi:hypothetical protein